MSTASMCNGIITYDYFIVIEYVSVRYIQLYSAIVCWYTRALCHHLSNEYYVSSFLPLFIPSHSFQFTFSERIL